MVGVLLPFLLITEKLKNQQIVAKVDNIGCFFGWENRSVTEDTGASILIRVLHLVSSYLGCVVHVQHLPRMSSWDAKLADRLSREATTTANDQKLLDSFPKKELPLSRTGWEIPQKITPSPTEY
jgi:hypothetical protein